MVHFQYKHGDRPLEGYTIQRGAGRGGFGEVYYAVSDAGREVALKALNAYEQIELRGVGHCMNLKNPHLVTIFDVRHNDQGRPFVIMEYVAGPSLRQLLDESPAGLGTQKAAFFLREIGKGLTYLHDHGIVHRDLKPANIFFENGYVKIGDYGLSKLIAATHTSAQTVTVGTVHYMAPEIGVGRYDRGIDIYALGAVLYEMLTGTVPFTGASPSEVLLKHLGSEPDMTGIAEPFATVIRKAMAKDASQRYQSVQEMVEAVFGAEHVRQSVSVFSPDQLSVVAAYAAQRVPAGAAVGGSGGSAAAGATTTASAGARDALGRDPAAAGDHVRRFGEALGRFGNRMGDLGARVIGDAQPRLEGIDSRTAEVTPPAAPADAPADTMTPGQRRLIALIAAAAAGVVAALLAQDRRGDGAVPFLFVTLAALGGAFGIRLAVRRLTPQMFTEPEAVHRIGVGGLAALGAAVLSFPFWVEMRNPAGLWIAVLVPLFFMNAARWAAPDREQRVTFWDTTFLVALFAFVLSVLFHDSPLPVVTAVAICLVTQILSPWVGPRPAAAAEDAADERAAAASAPPPPLPPPPLSPRVGAGEPPQTYPPDMESRLARRLDESARRIEQLHKRELRRRRREQSRGGGRRFSFFSPIAGLLILAASLVALPCALHVPAAIEAGLPDPAVTRDFDRLFAGVDAWPRLLTRMGVAAAALLTVLAAAATALARRHWGIVHVLRGLFGLALLMSSIFMISKSFHAYGWQQVAYHVQRDQPAGAIAAFFDGFGNAILGVSAVLFIAAVVVLVWPPSRRPASAPAATPPPAPQPAPASPAPPTEGAVP